jgi:hypothetical protein
MEKVLGGRKAGIRTGSTLEIPDDWKLETKAKRETQNRIVSLRHVAKFSGSAGSLDG